MKEKHFSSKYIIYIVILFTCLFIFSTTSLSLIPGDFGSANNGPPDGVVDFEDLMIFALAYGSTPSDANWNEVCDIASKGGVLQPDGIIDFEDLMIFAMNYGKECPSEEGILVVVSAQIDLEIGGVVEVTDEESEIYGSNLVIDPINKELLVNRRGLSEIAILLNAQVLGTNYLGDFQGWLITPVGVTAAEDIIGLIQGSLKIKYNEMKLSNSGVAKDSIPNVYRVLCRFDPNTFRPVPVPGASWEEVPAEKITHETDKVKIDIGIGDLLYLYTLTVTNCDPDDDLGTPLPGDLLYRLSEVGVNDNWVPGHVGIYVGERYGDHDKDSSTPDIVYNVIEALGGPSGPNSVLGNPYPDITKFGSDQYVYMGAREPAVRKLTHQDRNDIVKYAKDQIGMKYALFDTIIGIYFGLARGENVKGPDYNCVGLAEAAYEWVGAGIVSDDDEGNNPPLFAIFRQDYLLSPQEQLFRTVPASGIIDQNTAPDIFWLEMVPENPKAGDSVNVTCHATDQDGDDLSYEWTIEDGNENIIDNFDKLIKGKQIDFQIPSIASNYKIICRVFDNYGGEAIIDYEGSSGQEILTPEEMELIREWGYGGDYVIRWPDGYVDVYDETNYSRMQEVINEWNVAISGPVILRLSSNSDSPVKVIFDWSLEEEGFCGRYYNRWENYTFSEAVIKINPYCESYNYPLYLSMFNAVAGFNFWAEVSPCPFETWSNFNIIPDMIRKMVYALHKVYPGYSLVESKLKINQTSTVTEDMQSNAKGGCAANYRK